MQPTSEPPYAIRSKQARLRRRLPAGENDELRDVLVFTLFRDGYSGSLSAVAPVEAFDAVGTRVL